MRQHGENRGKAVEEYVHDWIVKVTDITDYVNDLNALRINNEDISDRLPKEMVYKMNSLAYGDK